MKRTIYGMAISFIFLAACNPGNNSNTSEESKNVVGEVAPPLTNTISKADMGVKGIIDGYLRLKNSLAADNEKDAAIAGNEIIAAMDKVDTTAMSADQKKTYAAVSDDVKEHAEHISENSGKLDHQREHFEMLSKDVYDLVKTFGGGQTLYKDYCPMAFSKKGASWLSETKDIHNPYMGSEMPDCGEVKEELK